jgi:hypothetical protein
MRVVTIVAASVLAVIGAGWVLAGTEKVSFPDGFRSQFVRYTTVDKPERKPPIVRFMYVNPAALAAAKPGQAAPHGTVIVMEDHRAKLDADGTPLQDSAGRFVPTDEITSIFVQAKDKGWGAEYPEDKRNGEWEYAWFNADGTRRTGPKVNLNNCFACHKENVEHQDYTFTFAPFVESVKK